MNETALCGTCGALLQTDVEQCHSCGQDLPFFVPEKKECRDCGANVTFCEDIPMKFCGWLDPKDMSLRTCGRCGSKNIQLSMRLDTTTLDKEKQNRIVNELPQFWEKKQEVLKLVLDENGIVRIGAFCLILGIAQWSVGLDNLVAGADKLLFKAEFWAETPDLIRLILRGLILVFCFEILKSLICGVSSLYIRFVASQRHDIYLSTDKYNAEERSLIYNILDFKALTRWKETAGKTEGASLSCSLPKRKLIMKAAVYDRLK